MEFYIVGNIIIYIINYYIILINTYKEILESNGVIHNY
jgi:hypothetical protein